ncbi:ATP-binding protein [Magnetospirillum sp. UT-4]|uniref:sensor histidine kinase n=1 Tax=Magnetospirillum sp. UT-4 TaxID=2681467 RepID=UPI0013824AF4|nr:ATP-binding protein [Magnetospirillum sp. UT-4]CAA7614099.1 putative Histidine kinase [Magnetospirillum sp. UT-4]
MKLLIDRSDSFRKSLRFRLIVASVVVEVVMLALLIGNSMRQANLHLGAMTQARVAEMAETLGIALGPPLAARDHASLRSLVDGLVTLPDIAYLAVTDRDGRTLAGAGALPSPLPPPDSSVVATEAAVHDAVAPIVLYGQTYGDLHYGLSLEALRRAKRDVLIQGVAIAAAEILLSIAALASLTLLLTRRLENLTRASVRLAAGDYGTEVPIRGNDEIAALSAAFNAMADAVRSQVVRLEDNAVVLRRSNEELRKMAEVTAHHLQEPLRRVVSYSQLLKRRYGEELDADARDFIDYVVEGAVGMKRQLIDLQAYVAIDIEPVTAGSVADLGECVRLACTTLRKPIETAGAAIEIGDLPRVPGDARQMALLFEQIIGNSLTHGVEGRAPRITVNAARSNGTYVLCVADNGTGIPPEYHKQVFELFERLDVDARGTGIGLAMVRKIVERHGGHAWIETAPTGGAVVCFTLRAFPAGQD